MQKFKKIYVEITNMCNLNCSFCNKSNRKPLEMSIDNFRLVANKIKEYTEYIYLHVKGEPLIHSQLDEILTICDEFKFKVNITTNATLLNSKYYILNRHDCIRQLNVSLHSENANINYYENVFKICQKLSSKMFISYRIWTLKSMILDEKSAQTVEKIISFYDLSTDIVDKLYKNKQIKIDINTFVDKENEFIWPDLKNNITCEGYCHALKDQIAILSDGTVIPCCLDSEGIINLGNILSTDLDNIINSNIFRNIKEGFSDNKCVHPLCIRCNFKKRFIKQ